MAPGLECGHLRLLHVAQLQPVLFHPRAVAHQHRLPVHDALEPLTRRRDEVGRLGGLHAEQLRVIDDGLGNRMLAAALGRAGGAQQDGLVHALSPE